MAVRRQLQDAVHIHSIAQSLTHTHIVEGLFGVIEIQRLHQVHGALQHRVLIAEVLSLGHGQVHNQVHRTTVERRHQRGGILIDLQRHAVHLGTFAPVVAELFQYDVFLHTARNIPERPGADRRGGLLGIIVRNDVH